MNNPAHIYLPRFLALVALGFGALTSAACTTEKPAEYTSGLAIENVNVIDVVEGEARAEQTVVVEGNRIVEIAPASAVRLGKEVQRIDGSGRYLIPGLWDMHSHTWDAESTRHVVFPLEIANGVVGIRNMAGDCHGDSQDCSERARVEEIEALERDINEGRLLGPEIHNGSTFLDGRHSIKDESVMITSTHQARKVVREHARRGFDFLKVYDYLRPDVYHALADEAKKQGIPFAGHVPWTVSVKEAAEAGQISMEHGYGWFKATSGMEKELIDERRKALETDEFTRQDRFDLLFSREDSQYVRMLARKEHGIAFQQSASALEELAAVLRENETWQAPTLTMNGRMLLADDLLSGDMMKYLPPKKRRAWSEVVAEAEEMEPQVRAFHRASLEALFRTVGVLHDAGVGFLAGTDCDVDLIAPGFHLHKELELFVRAGLTPAEALRTATMNPARYLGRESEMGTVEEGKVADLVLLDANPLEDIRNTQRIQAVVLDGQLLDRARLDEVLEEVEEYAAAADGPSPAASSEGRGPTLVVENGRVIVGDGTVLEQGAVVVSGDRILEVTEDAVDAPDARRIDASGKTVLPGLIDAHVHITEEPGIGEFGKQYLAFGTTTVRDAGGSLERLLDWRERWRTGGQLGPRLFMAGHPLDGYPPNWPYPGIAWPITGAEEARLAVTLQRRLGVDFIKLYSALDPEVLKAAIEAAHEQGLAVTADLARYTESVDSVFKWGLDSFEHGFARCCGEPVDHMARPSWRLDRERVSELVDLLVEQNITLVSTAVINDRMIRGEFPPDTATYRALPPKLQEASRDMWERERSRQASIKLVDNIALGWPDEVCGPIRRFVERGGTLALGTDSFFLAAYPGDVIAEAEFHAGCGLPPATILAALTRNAAQLLGRDDELGTLEAGKLADLIVVDGDPLEDVSALWNVEMVLKDGAVVSGSETLNHKALDRVPEEEKESGPRDGEWRIIAGVSAPRNDTELQSPEKGGSER